MELLKNNFYTKERNDKILDNNKLEFNLETENFIIIDNKKISTYLYRKNIRCTEGLECYKLLQFVLNCNINLYIRHPKFLSLYT